MSRRSLAFVEAAEGGDLLIAIFGYHQAAREQKIAASGSSYIISPSFV
jgi:hypothetical protein